MIGMSGLLSSLCRFEEYQNQKELIKQCRGQFACNENIEISRESYLMEIVSRIPNVPSAEQDMGLQALQKLYLQHQKFCMKMLIFLQLRKPYSLNVTAIVQNSAHGVICVLIRRLDICMGIVLVRRVSVLC